MSTAAPAKPTPTTRPKAQPRYRVILWDSENHTYQYVIEMLYKVFRKPLADGLDLAEHIDAHGMASVLVTSLEHAELKRDQVHAWGEDARASKPAGSMCATIEPVE